ncbi:riboflavin kinase [Fadolivirus algeromassiliense]|jgi:riboflavin kinase|uniref:riboflavin kinase n=1 Tax=Fadolivirus FV1/VV64 TaxID=3070911 RepID=A0A7D3QUF2_9VIRU|nr:riboflavin kinase [Fadolivirus algeromassiliense]QKF93484.1 riboflavin kinase [Fadolivirus FV1/VV64]
MEFPIRTSGVVIHGFGRGSKQLGFPTANLDIHIDNCDNGVFYGYANLPNEPKQKMVMSIGNNPHFENINKTYEVHILKNYDNDFYGEILTIEILGKIRDMKKFNSLDELIKAIEEDIEYAINKLNIKI